MKTSSSRVHPTTCAFGPMRQLLAMFSEWRAELLRTAFSMMMHSRPILIDPPSAITCAPNMMRQLGPIVTLPQITAFGATQAAGSIRGVAPSCLMIIWHLHDLCIFPQCQRVVPTSANDWPGALNDWCQSQFHDDHLGAAICGVCSPIFAE